MKEYNLAIQVAVAEKDNGSRDLFVQLLKDEEDHVDWLEAQMHMIKELGYERYLTMQMGEDEEVISIRRFLRDLCPQLRATAKVRFDRSA